MECINTAVVVFCTVDRRSSIHFSDFPTVPKTGNQLRPTLSPLFAPSKQTLRTLLHCPSCISSIARCFHELLRLHSSLETAPIAVSESEFRSSHFKVILRRVASPRSQYDLQPLLQQALSHGSAERLDAFSFDIDHVYTLLHSRGRSGTSKLYRRTRLLHFHSSQQRTWRRHR